MRPLSCLLPVALACCATLGPAIAGAKLHDAAAAGEIEEIDRLIAEGASVNVLKWKAYAPLYYAAKKGQLETVKHLVEVHGASVDHGSSPTTSPLHGAVSGGHRDIAEYLVLRGADSTAVGYFGKGRKRTAYSARLTWPNWPWDRWVEERTVELERARELSEAADADRVAERQAAAEAERMEMLSARWERDSRLPVGVRKDKYLLALRKNLDQGDHDSALIYFDFLRRLDVPLGPTFDLYHGQILLDSGETDEALDKLYLFVQAVDASDPNYTHALELINRAEEQ